MLEDALLRGKEAYSFLLDINHKGVVVNIAPILVDSQIEGAVLTFQEGQRLIDMDSEMRRELYQRGFVAGTTSTTSSAMTRRPRPCSSWPSGSANSQPPSC